MLVLSRKQSERIRVGNDIVVTVVRVAGDKVRLGIEAPSNVVVLRDELESHDTADACAPTTGAKTTAAPAAASPALTSSSIPAIGQ